MAESVILNIEEQQLPPVLDTHQLREQARQHIEKIAGVRWTDYNTHDPGITILEVLAYAITDLGLRVRLPLVDLVSGRDSKPFFTAREVLPSAVWTSLDYKCLLIDNLPVRNAWVTSTSGAFKGLHQLLLDLAPHIPAALPADLQPLELNEVWLRGTLLLPDAKQYDYDVLFPEWDQLPGLWEDEKLGLSKVEVSDAQLAYDSERKKHDQFFITLRLTFGTGTAAQTLEDAGFWILLPKGINKIEPEEFNTPETDAIIEALKAPLNNPGLLQIFQNHQTRARMRRARLTQARQLVLKHRNLCEDWDSIDTVRIQQVGFRIAQLDLQPEADPIEVLARIWVAFEQFISPEPKPLRFDERLHHGVTAAEIFDGPLPKNGFFTAEDFQQNQREDLLYASDFVRLAMQQPEVVGVNRLVLDLYINRSQVVEGAANCLRLLNIERLKPKFSFYDTEIQVFKGDIPLTVDKEAVRKRWLALKKASRVEFTGNDSADLPIPMADGQLDIATFFSIQNEFPETYGLRAGEIVSSATALRKAQAKQLKAYLLFFEQLLANYCQQLDRVQDLFSIRSDIDRSYSFQALYDVPDIKNLYQAFLQSNPAVNWEQFTARSNGYIKALDDLTENRDTFLRRRNQFIDHLLSRFSESFSDYAAWSYARNGGRLSPDLVFDKLNFLQRIPELSANRSMGFNYAATRSVAGQPVSDVWDTANVSGYEKRVAALLGIPDSRRRILGEKFDIQRYRSTTDVQGTGANQKGRFRIQNIPVGSALGTPKTLLVSDKAYLLTELDARFSEVSMAGRNAGTYWPQQDSDTKATTSRYNFILAEPKKDQPDQPGTPLPAKGPDEFFTNRALLEAHIQETMHLLQGRPAEGMHLVEHVLLRPFDGVSQVLQPGIIKINDVDVEAFIPDPYAFQLSIFLPGWAPRFQDPGFRGVVERRLREELPAHIFPWMYWVNLNPDTGLVPAEFTAFETAWRKWLEKQFSNERAAALDQLVLAMNQLVVSPYVTLAYRYQPFDLSR